MVADRAFNKPPWFGILGQPHLPRRLLSRCCVGPFPSIIAGLLNLEELDISHNSFYGESDKTCGELEDKGYTSTSRHVFLCSSIGWHSLLGSALDRIPPSSSFAPTTHTQEVRCKSIALCFEDVAGLPHYDLVCNAAAIFYHHPRRRPDP